MNSERRHLSPQEKIAALATRVGCEVASNLLPAQCHQRPACWSRRSWPGVAREVGVALQKRFEVVGVFGIATDEAGVKLIRDCASRRAIR
jgi:hypothetical protein